ncbi:acyltransferase-like protein At1g54570, chloroplastic [Ipomoea triloba]|uniref:acyltransferase-like protein At1g54570, chloroplastic n=1 Tax=Ipomoea triloba TaxID=35885 RepID=UPI00125E3D56|nr:acyltransferase-like protein At1g54570, chloroplastic [Ipomoea triloba]
MALIMQSFKISSYFWLNSEHKLKCGATNRCLASRDSTVFSSDSIRVNGISSGWEKERSSLLGNGDLGTNVGEEKRKEGIQEKLEALWDDGYGTQNAKDYLELAQEITRPDGRPPRWFTPLSCGPPLKHSPALFFLPGVGGSGLGLILHHKALGKVFEIWSLNIPVNDRTPFIGLVKLVEQTIRMKHESSPDKPIYLVGDSFGGCLALAVAARNPTIDLVVILTNPATSFGRSQLQPFFPLLEAFPDNHVSFPNILSYLGDLTKMPMENIKIVPPSSLVSDLYDDLAALLSKFNEFTDFKPKETLAWKLKLLKSASEYANSRLHAVTAEVLVLASGKDNVLPSEDEAKRLARSLRNCKVRYFNDKGHRILLENGFNLLSIIKGTSTYRRSRRHDYVLDYLPPSMSEFKKAFENNRFYRYATDPVMLSTMENGTIVRGLAGVPNEGPVLLVGYHMLMGLEMIPLVEEFLKAKKVVLRAVAHPTFFTQLADENGSYIPSFIVDMVRLYGALPVSASNLFKLLATKSHVLLYPGGAREALHRKGEEYKVMWPDQPEFVRMAAKFGATIVPFGAVGEDDLAQLVLDYDDLTKIPIVSDAIRRSSELDDKMGTRLRTNMGGEVANQTLYIPGMLPKVPGRLYYLFGKPISTKGKPEILKDREEAHKLYLEVKSEVENSMAYLLKKREEDPYRSLFSRTAYRALSSPFVEVPTFEC